ncbi:MAG TPA: glycosyltransferase, partial [Anaerolineales bacterium]|nr:glycosyltransferase [Anaerolineales bacterium]
PGDVARLAEAILDLLRDPEKRRRMGAKGRETAQQRFAIDGVVRAYAALYREMGLAWSAAG